MTYTPFTAFAGLDNAALDGLFYDVDILRANEREELACARKVEGMILEVGPSTAPSIKLWKSLKECPPLAPRYAAITVAGVGSSAVGAAALARNVADALGAPVLAVVSGHGMGDLASEAMGGFFLFGGLNALRHGFASLERTMDAMTWMLPKGSRPWLGNFDPGQSFQLSRYSKDVKALTGLLAERVETDLLVGHSKGNLVISEALYALKSQHKARFAAMVRDLRVVTFGARIAMPSDVKTVVDVMGEMDTLGDFNSRPDIARDVTVPSAWHHTNTRLPNHVPVTRVLKNVLAG
ncbi:MAG: hypothetical protein ACKO1N_09945 [Erythrobacter sp.]